MITIKATKEQVIYLSNLAEAAALHHLTVSRLKNQMDSVYENASKGGFSSVRAEDLSNLQKRAGALMGLLSMKWAIFNPYDEDQAKETENIREIEGWIKLAMTPNPEELEGRNWFTWEGDGEWSSVGDPSMDIQLERSGVKTLRASESVYVEPNAGVMIWTAIKEAIKLRDDIKKPVTFTFNDRILKVGLKSTVEEVAAQYDRQGR